MLEKFFGANYYVQGSYDKSEDFQHLNSEIHNLQKAGRANRLFYMALPPSVYDSVASQIHANCMSVGLVWYLQIT